MKADYGWIIFLVIGVIIAVSWSSIRGGINAFQNRNFDQAAYDRGAALFADKNAWTPLENKSCAMCHSASFVEETEAPTMPDYVKGSPVELKNLRGKYKSDMLGNKDALFEQVMVCMTDPNRMALHRASEKSTTIKDLMEYLRNQ